MLVQGGSNQQEPGNTQKAEPSDQFPISLENHSSVLGNFTVFGKAGMVVLQL